MTRSGGKPISAIRVSPTSIRVLEASIEAASSGPGFRTLSILGLSVGTILFLLGTGAAGYAGLALLRREPGALEVFALTLVFAVIAGLLLAALIRFQRRLGERNPG